MFEHVTPLLSRVLHGALETLPLLLLFLLLLLFNVFVLHRLSRVAVC
jgi:hypothetical protein